MYITQIRKLYTCIKYRKKNTFYKSRNYSLQDSFYNRFKKQKKSKKYDISENLMLRMKKVHFKNQDVTFYKLRNIFYSSNYGIYSFQ